MTSALLGAATCGRCVAAITADDHRCPRCGVRLEAVAPGSAVTVRVGPLVGVVAARGARRWTAVVVDVAVIVLAAGATGALVDVLAGPLAHRAELVLLAALLAGGVALAVLTAVVRATGSSPGRRVAGSRVVDALTGLPPRSVRHALVAVLAGRSSTTVDADLRAGRDPLLVRIEPISTPVDVDAEALLPPIVATIPTPTDAAAARLVLESGEELLVDGPMLLGRAPEPVRGIDRLQTLPDLTRGIARTHLLVDWSDGLLWVTDLGAPGGTTVRSDADTFQPLVPQVRTAVAPGWQLLLGGRTLTVRSVAVEEGAARGR